MGLLERVLEVQERLRQPPVETLAELSNEKILEKKKALELISGETQWEIDPVSLVQNLLRASQLIKPTLSQVYDFFNLLVDCLGLSKAALLLTAEPETMLQPWCLRGFDETTQIKLRTDRFNNTLFQGEENYLLGQPDKLPVVDFFSTHDFAMMEKLLLLPIVNKGLLVGLLIIADSPYLQGYSTEVSMIFTAIQTLLRQIVQKHRQMSHANNFIQCFHDDNEIEFDFLETKLFCMQQRQVIVIHNKEIADHFTTEYPNLLPTAFEQDIRSHVLGFLQRYAEFMIQSKDVVCIVLNEESSLVAEEIIGLLKNELVDSLGFVDNVGVESGVSLVTVNELYAPKN